jgi:hypothetical protein
MIEAIIKPTLSQEEATLEFAVYLQQRMQARLGNDDVRMLARMLRQSMLLVRPEDRKNATELLKDPWFINKVNGLP